MINILLISLSALYILFLIVFNSFNTVLIREIINTNLPFRESYSPTLIGFLYVYILPVTFGFIFSKLLASEKIRSYMYFVNLALILTLISFFPFIVNDYVSSYWFDNITEVYNLIFFPVLFLLGSLSVCIFSNLLKENETKKINPIISNIDIIIAFLLGILMLIINFIPPSLSDYLIGADVYYHAALTQNMVQSLDITQNPFFDGEKNYYYSIAYFILALSSKFSGIDVQKIWLLYTPTSACIFIICMYFFTKKSTGSSVASLLTCLFIIPLNQILWVDPSIRILSYTFFSLLILSFQGYLLKKRYIYIFLAIIFFILTIGSHPEVAIHTVLIFLFFFVFSYSTKFIPIFHKIFSKIFNPYRRHASGYYLKSLDNPDNLLLLLTIFLFVLLHKLVLVISNFPINGIIVFNEIPLSIFQPIGPISFLVFLFFPIGVIDFIKKLSSNNILVLSIACLMSSIFFYFTHLWQFYHRYFAETAYLGLSILAAYGIVKFIPNFTIRKKILFIMIVSGYLVLSLYPKYLFTTSAAYTTDKSMNSRIQDLQFIKSHTEPNSVILMNPDNILNRYVPFYSNRYIFAGSSIINRDHQWKVLSFCAGPFSKTCDTRMYMADDFFTNPSKEKLKMIKNSYRLDYLLINKFDSKEITAISSSDLTIDNYYTGENINYILYDVKGI